VAAPTLQAEGAQNQVTSGTLTLTLPAHATDDILVSIVLFWLPATAGSAATIPDLAGWTKAGSVMFPGTPDGEVAFFWKRAASGAEANPVFTRGASWDTGTDGIYAGRAHVIRGCVTTGDPWDELDATVAHTTANQAVDAVTVSGSERMVVQFLGKTDDFATAPTISGWTAGSQTESGTGTDSSFGTFRKDNVSSSTAADASTVEAVVAGAYVFFGVSFKPGVAPVTGVALGAFTFSGTAAGTPDVTGAAVAAVTFSGASTGVRDTTGQAAAPFAFGATAAGVPDVSGAALAAIVFTATASGAPGGAPPVEGQALGAFTFTGVAQGVPDVAGQGLSSLAFTGTVTGEAGHVGSAVSSFTFGATAGGVPGVIGQAASAETFSAVAAGVRGVSGQAVASLMFTATASGAVVGPVVGTALGAFTLTAVAVGFPERFGVASVAFSLIATASGGTGATDVTLRPYTGITVDPTGVTVRPFTTVTPQP